MKGPQELPYRQVGEWAFRSERWFDPRTGELGPAQTVGRSPRWRPPAARNVMLILSTGSCFSLRCARKDFGILLKCQ